MMKKILAWHFTDGMKLRDGQPLVVGKTYTFDGTPILCEQGYHASVRLINALWYAPGAQVSRVELWGNVREDNEKFVAKNRTVLWTLDATMILHEFACQVAEEALLKILNPDPRSTAAIAVKRRWMRGEATDEELEAAFYAADEAAYAVGYAAARAAAHAARAAAYAAHAAAHAAHAAAYAAYAAAHAAHAAAYAAYAVTAVEMSNRLERMVLRAHDEEAEV